VSEHVTITIDGREIEVPAGKLLIEAAQERGTYIPRFCWHERMKPVGMCRMCLVEIEGPRGTMLTTSCTTPVAEGMVVHTESETVKKAQEGILEFLLINHPLDCPVCDRGGECPLQDQTLSHGPGESRFVEEKRHFEKPIPISDLVLLDRERCILCARCTRFSEEISGDPLIEFIDRGSHTQVLTFPGEPFASYFSGNTVQICPVGALTATPYRFRARPWDLEAVESTCPHCPVGCRMSVQASRDVVLRFNGVDVEATNHGWLCDKGRFGFEYLDSADRLTTPLVDGEETGWAEALDAAAAGLKAIVDEHGPDAVAGLGGATATNEEAFAFSRLMRSVIGTGNLDARMGDGLDPSLLTGPRGAIGDLERAATVLVWGPDLKEEVPVLYLRVRRAAAELGAELVVVHPRRTGLDDVAAHTVRYRPGEGAGLLERLRGGEGDLAAVREALGRGPVVAIVGRTGLADDPGLPVAVAEFAAGLPEASLLPATRAPNVFGAADMGLLPDEGARDAEGIVSGLEDGSVKGLVLFASDPLAGYPDQVRAAAALAEAEFVVAFDLFRTASNGDADVVFPALGFAEIEGTVTNLEGRVQKVNRLVSGPGRARPSWEVLEDLARRLGGTVGGSDAASLAAAIEAEVPGYAGITWDALDWGEGRDGMIAASPARNPVSPVAVDRSGDGLALHLGRVLYEHDRTIAHGPSLAKLVPEPAAYLHPDDAAAHGIAAGDRVVLHGSRGSAELDAALDDSLAPGTVYLPFNVGASVGSGLSVRVEVAR